MRIVFNDFLKFLYILDIVYTRETDERTIMRAERIHEGEQHHLPATMAVMTVFWLTTRRTQAGEGPCRAFDSSSRL